MKENWTQLAAFEQKNVNKPDCHFVENISEFAK